MKVKIMEDSHIQYSVNWDKETPLKIIDINIDILSSYEYFDIDGLLYRKTGTRGDWSSISVKRTTENVEENKILHIKETN